MDRTDSPLRIERGNSGDIAAITMPRTSNFHAHVRWDQMIEAVAPEVMRFVKYVLCMPNNGPGRGGIIRTLSDAYRVHNRLLDIRAKHGLNTLTRVILTLYHTRDITPDVIESAMLTNVARALKDYPTDPKGTTNAGHGAPFDDNHDVARVCVQTGFRRLFHAEDTHDLYGRPLPHRDREAHCITHRLWRFRDKYPGRYCIEHASTREAIEFVKADPSGDTVMTVTPQHLLFTEEDFKKYSWRNHLRCMPYVKTEDDRQALLDFVTSGDPRCIAGDDTAPHPRRTKEFPDLPQDEAFEKAHCGCWVPHSIALYALAFMQRNAMDDRFVNFMCYNGPDWWHLERPSASDTIRIVATKDDIPHPLMLPERDDVVIPLGWSEHPDRLAIGYATALAY
jgi:dihydroorotase